ncbi:MAG TPA: YCF48-related protein, partial [bacterium]|nr:YCF48-related protein [bacterium]
MSVVNRRNAAVIGSLVLLCSLSFAGWTPLVSGTTNALYSVCFPAGTQVGYAVGVGGTVLKTTDGGTTWTAESSGAIGQLNSVFFNDNNNGVAVGNRGTIIKTTDGGATWTKPTSGVTYPLTYVGFPGKGQTGYIGVNHVDSLASALKSTDGGSTWSSLPAGGVMDKGYGAYFATVNNGIIFGYSGLCLGTTNGSTFAHDQSWFHNGPIVAAAASPTTPTKAYLIGNDETLGMGVIRNTMSFPPSLWDTAMTGPYPAAPVAYYGITFATDSFAYVCGAGGFIGVTNTPTNVTATSTPGVTGAVNGLSFPSADTGYAVGEGGMILKTTDGGRPWAPGVAEGKAPVVPRAGLRVLSNPGRYGISVHSDANVPLTVFDA